MLVGAENVAQLDAVTKVYIESAQENEGIALAFNSIGWKSQNLLFNLIDAIIGDPLIGDAMGGQQPAKVEALIERTDVDAGGDVAVVAVNAAVINAELSNESAAVVVMVWGSGRQVDGLRCREEHGEREHHRRGARHRRVARERHRRRRHHRER